MSQKNKTIREIKKANYDVDKTLRNIGTLFESVKEDYYKPIRTGNAFSSNYSQYERNGDKIQTTKIKRQKTKYYQLKNILIKWNRI